MLWQRGLPQAHGLVVAHAGQHARTDGVPVHSIHRPRVPWESRDQVSSLALPDVHLPQIGETGRVSVHVGGWGGVGGEKT